MTEIRYHIPQFILWVLFWILVIAGFIYLSWLGEKIDKIYSILDVNSTCEDISN